MRTLVDDCVRGTYRTWVSPHYIVCLHSYLVSSAYTHQFFQYSPHYFPTTVIIPLQILSSSWSKGKANRSWYLWKPHNTHHCVIMFWVLGCMIRCVLPGQFFFRSVPHTLMTVVCVCGLPAILSDRIICKLWNFSLSFTVTLNVDSEYYVSEWVCFLPVVVIRW